LPLAKLRASWVPAARRLWGSLPSRSMLPQILGGSGAVQGEWSFMAFIIYVDSASNPVFICTGTLVSANVVLTAGHCVFDETTGAGRDPIGYRVGTGAVDLRDT